MTRQGQFSTWFVSLVVLCCLYGPLWFFDHKHMRFDAAGIPATLSFFAVFPGLAAARFFPRELGPWFYYGVEIAAFAGSIWLARRGTIWFVVVAISALVVSLVNIREMFRWG